MGRIVTLVFLLVVSFQSFAQQTINASLTVSGVQRSYILYIPANYNNNNKAPLVFNFHGYTNTANGQKNRAAFESIADTAGFIVASPQGTDLGNASHWNVGGWTSASTADDIGFTSTMIDSISANYNIDAERIYSTGFSNGGFFSYRLACEMSNKIAAIASVAGSFTDLIQNNCNPQHPTPILQIHGTNDVVIPYGGGALPGSKPIDDVLKYWVNYNNCDTNKSTTTLPDTDPNDGSTVEHTVYNNGDQGVTVELLRVIGGAHQWPGNSGNMDISASLEIWKFFSRYKLTVSVDDILTNTIHNTTLYPNPSNGQTTLSYYAEKAGNTTVTIIDMTGRTVYSKDINYQRGNNMQQLNIQHLSKGIYMISMESITLKLVIQ